MDFSFDPSPENLAIFASLFLLELVLGIDNVIFISILVSRLPREQQSRARNLGLTLAMLMRIVLVFFAGWLITLTEEIIQIAGMSFSAKDIIMILGGLFLVYKAVHEIHLKLEGVEEAHADEGKKTLTFGSAIAQILALDLVFSLDSVITAIGMTTNMILIVLAVVLSFGIMLFASAKVFAFVNRHPTVKMLALSFLMLVGVFLIAEGFGYHVDKALIYGPMAFAVLVEALNLAASSRKAKRENAKLEAVHLRPTYPDIDESVAVNAAISTDPAAGSVGLSRKPVEGAAAGDGERAGLG